MFCFFCPLERSKRNSRRTLGNAVNRIAPSNKVPSKTVQPPNNLYEQLQKRAHSIVLPGEMWFVYVERGSHILFAKTQPDLQLSFKVVIYPDMNTKISYYGKVISWLQANVRSEDSLVEVLQLLDVLELPKFVP